MSLASVSDLSIYLNRELTGSAAQQAEMLLSIASNAVQAYCRQTLEYVEDDQASLVGNWGSTLTLPERPVVDVTSVSVDGTDLGSDNSWTWDGRDILYRGSWSDVNGAWAPQSDRPHLYWGSDEAIVEVTYSHGFPTIPPVIVGIVCGLAARGIANPSGAVQSETLGPYSVTYGSSTVSGASSLLASERKILRSGGYRR